MVSVYAFDLLSGTKERKSPSLAKRLEPMRQFCRLLLQGRVGVPRTLPRFAKVRSLQIGTTLDIVITGKILITISTEINTPGTKQTTTNLCHILPLA